MKGQLATSLVLGVAIRALLIGACSAALLLPFMQQLPVKAASAGLLVFLAWGCGEMAFRIVRQDWILIWSPLPWFLLASGAYFGLGPMIYFVGDQHTVSYCEAVWPVTWKDLTRATLLNGVGLGTLFWTWLVTARGSALRASCSTRRRTDSEVATMIGCYAVGLPCRMVGLLSEFGYVSFTPHGVLNWLGNFVMAGLVLLTFLAIRRGGIWWLLWAIMAGFELGTSLLMFSKLAVVLAFLPCSFGYLLARPSLRAAVFATALLVVVYLSSVSYVRFGRTSLSESNAGTVMDRMGFLHAYVRKDQATQLEDSKYGWLTRLNYANTQTFAIREYDEGRPGESFKLALIAWIPRLLWPGKPPIESGRDFYTRLTGNVGATFGMGLFAEAYWNGGWPYLILMSAAVGWLFAILTTRITTVLAAGDFWILPIAMLWIRAGTRVDGWFHTEIVGPAVFTFLYLYLLRIWQPRPRVSRRPPRVRNATKNEAQALPGV